MLYYLIDFFDVFGIFPDSAKKSATYSGTNIVWYSGGLKI